MRKLYQFYVDYGRHGSISGLFVEEEDNVKKLIGKTVDFDEALGKHSCVEVEIEEDMITMKSDDQEFIEKLVSLFNGHDTISGYNPFAYYEEDDEEDDYEEEEDWEDDYPGGGGE